MKRINSILSILGLTMLTGCRNKQAASIGIIGGADGPTAIFVAEKTINYYSMAIGIVIVLIALLVLLIIRKRR